MFVEVIAAPYLPFLHPKDSEILNGIHTKAANMKV
jgi:hypothetical protein